MRTIVKVRKSLEVKVMAIVLKELRRSFRLRKPITITIDPFTAGGGLFLFAGQCESGHTYTIEDT